MNLHLGQINLSSLTLCLLSEISFLVSAESESSFSLTSSSYLKQADLL